MNSTHINIRNLIITLMAFAMTATISCVNEIEHELEKENPYLVETVIPAGFDDSIGDGDSASKAQFDIETYPKIHWKEGDKIAVLGLNTGKQMFTALSSGNTTDFSGSKDVRDDILYAVYPYDNQVAYPTDDEINTSTNQEVEIMRVTIPSVQYATTDSFDPNAYVALAKSDGSNFTFKAACSFFKFSFSKDGTDVNSVKIVTNDNNGNSVTIAGTAGVKFYTNGIPSHGVGKTWVSGTGTNTITLCEKEGHIFSNDTFFIVTRANSCPAGITVYVEYEDGSIYTKSTSKQIFPTGKDRNSIMNLGSFDKDNGFQCIKEGVSLLDYSFAGYNYSEQAPIEISESELVHGNTTSTGYKVYDVTKFKTDENTDRDAFLAAVDEALGGIGYDIDGNGWHVFKHKDKANAIIYFPEGEYILHSSDDDVDGKSRSIQIRTSNLIIKGAGRDKTILVMQDPNLPTSAALYSSPDMIQLKHNSAHGNKTNVSVTADSPKGSHTLTLETTSGLIENQWVCLYISSTDKELLAEQMHPYTADESWKISTDGILVTDYHRIKSIDSDNNTVTFYEPIMTDIKAKYGWRLHDFPNYENIGIEDLSFKGNAKNGFVHHGSWEDDGAFKPISLQRVTNSWIRRVEFISTSEACSIINSANVSAYDIIMSGTNGHSAIRSQASSRVLIADTIDESGEGGHFHGVGVSKQSIGTVLWRNTWGNNSCFESHATQPRATLIDCCSGGWHRFHAGGDKDQAPHHLADLVIWNFTATNIGEVNYQWWGNANHNFLPPVISGFNGAVTFEGATILDKPNDGESLFEEQLKKRLGYIPEWLENLK